MKCKVDVSCDYTDIRMENNIAEVMTYLGEDITREGLVETPKRVRKALLEVCAGIHNGPKRSI